MADDRNYETTETSECSDAEHSSERSYHETKILIHDSDKTGKGAEGEDEHFEDFKTKVEIMVELGSDKLRSFRLSDCYTSDRPGMHLEILPKIIFDSVDDEADLDEIDLPKPIYRQTFDYGTQASIEFKSSNAQTLRSNLVNSWSQYEPRLCTEEEIAENIVSPSFQSFKDSAEESILASIAQNSIADSFFWDLTSLYDEELNLGKENKHALISGSFSCSESESGDRMISSIVWHPVHKDIFVASTIKCVSFEQRTKSWFESKCDSVLFYMWSSKNQFFPKLKLEYFNDIQVLKFNTSMPNLIAGGSLTGQVVLWDMKKDTAFMEHIFHDEPSVSKDESPLVQCCAVSNMDNIHKHGITDLQWIPKNFEVSSRGNVKKTSTNLSYQLVSCGLDGLLLFWDLRSGFPMKPGHPGPKKFHHLDNVWEPFHTIEVFAPESRKRKALTRFTLRTSFQFDNRENLNDFSEMKISGEMTINEMAEMDAMSTEFYAGCDDGQVLCGNFRLIRDEAGKFIVRYPDYYNSPHNSSISALACSPFIQDTFLSTGGKYFAIWEHNIKTEPIYVRQRPSYITSGQWSPSRPAVFILGFIDGSVEVWDLLNNLYEPYLFHYMSTSAIKSALIQSVSETEHIIVAGDAKGVVYSMTLLPELWIAADNEFEKTKQLIDIEASRIRKNMPEDSTESETSKRTEPPPIKIPETVKVEPQDEDILAKNYEAFLNLQNQQLRCLNLLKEDENIELDSPVS